MEKIAIKGDPKNAHKIIKYLKQLGRNRFNWYGNVNELYYYINLDNEIDTACYPPMDYTSYESWDEFENTVLNKNKMEKRNIEISLEKAKEWYKQGGDLREVALQAFSENELKDNFPTSWDEYNINADWDHINAGGLPGSANYCRFSTEEEAEAFVALGKLIQLRDEYWKLDNNWKPDWSNYSMKFAIGYENNKIAHDCYHLNSQILAFRTEKLRDKFYENFKDLIEEAKMFL